MIIRSIRLKNIKSYGKGPDGNGVTVSFEPGINRIAGRNGHGKSTLIEALGYALFLTEPEFEENFQIERYLLNHTAKEGEIDITFIHGSQTYRIERGIGRQSRRVTKVVQLSDGSICAEKDFQVSQFVCDLLKVPDSGRLKEMFSKLIGVKQGRLTWPFDSRSSEAKKFFEPLLDVAVFRECFDRLKPAVDIFKSQSDEQEKKRAAVKARIEERAESQEKLAVCRHVQKEAGDNLQVASQRLGVALKLKTDLEQRQKFAEAAKIKADQCQQALSHAGKFRETAEQAVTEAQTATEKMSQHRAAYTIFLETEANLAQLESRRAQRDEIKATREKNESARVRSEMKAAAARDQANEYSTQKAAKERASIELQAQVEPLTLGIESTKAAFAQEEISAIRAKQEMGTVADFVPRLQELSVTQSLRVERIRTLNTEIASWDPGKLSAAESAEQSAREDCEKGKDELARASERLKTLREQLRQISGGVCPFLKEQCRQFEPAKVNADLESCQTTIVQLQARDIAAKAVFGQVKTALDRWRTANQEIAHKRNELQNVLDEYTKPLSAIVPENTRSAVVWLSVWENALAPMPQPPMAPEARVQSVLTSHSEYVAYFESINQWWLKALEHCNLRLDRFDQQERRRQRDEDAIKSLSSRINDLTKEIESFKTKIAQALAEAAAQQLARNTSATKVALCDEQLKPYATLDADMRGAQGQLAANRPGHAEYLKAKGLADQFETRVAHLARCKQEEASAGVALTQARVDEKQAAEAFDPEKLRAACDDHQDSHDAATRLTFTLEHLKKELNEAETRFAAWQQHCRELSEIERELGRLQAAMDLTDAARRTLRDTAPEVARHICRRIAQRAQRVFNRINPEPIELEWESDHYSLRIVPGDRRFAMLSGGEQTKLALAMTLAMIEEFSGLRFCVFDEPTYGIDADSRQKLADAILEAQEAAGLEQVLLVSHDDAFEGKIEHSIVLNKTGAAGTMPL